MKFKSPIILSLLFLFSITEIKGQDVDDLLINSSHPEAFWSLTVLDENGETLESFNSEKLVIPASNQKLYTLGAVLDRLGSQFRYETKIFRTGEITDSVLYGDMIIKGSGDPSISGFLYEEDRYYVFQQLTNQLKSNGISEIAGSIIANTGYFDDNDFPIGWDWYDMSFYYGVEIAPLSFNNNTIDLIVDANGEVGEKPSISWFPENTDYVTFQNDQEITVPTKKYDEDYRKRLGKNEIFLGSRLPQGYLEEESLAISEAERFFLESFEEFLNNNGITTSGKQEVQQEYIADHWKNYPVIAVHSSYKLSELLKWANKESDNFYTEMLLKTLAAQQKGIPGSFDNGIKEVKEFLADQQVDTNYVIMKDGSGLATGNFTTTKNLSSYLFAMKDHEESEVFYESFPIAGIDGSIAHRFKGTELYNNLRAKTGYIGGIRTLSGYFKASSGKEITFSLATNHFTGKVRPVDNYHQTILEFLYQKY